MITLNRLRAIRLDRVGARQAARRRVRGVDIAPPLEEAISGGARPPAGMSVWVASRRSSKLTASSSLKWNMLVMEQYDFQVQ